MAEGWALVNGEPRQSGKLFEADCCPGLVYLRASFSDHTAGAEGDNHKTINGRLDKLCQQQTEMMAAIERIEVQVDTLSRRQWYVTGAIAVIVGVLTWLGPSGLKGLFSIGLAALTGGWNG